MAAAKEIVQEELEVRVAEHMLVPKHEILNQEECEEICKKFNIIENQLPKVYSTDPAIKEIGAKTGDVIKITRKSQTAGRTVYYRLVIGGGHGE